MEAVTAGAAAAGTGSKTIADLLPLAVQKYGDSARAAVQGRARSGGHLLRRARQAVKEVALGLVDLGLEHGDKVSILAHTRPEWTDACFGILTAGGTLVTIYQTNSRRGVPVRARALRVAGGLRGGRRAAGQGPRGRGRLPRPGARDRHGPGDAELGDAISLEQLRERGARPRRLRVARRATRRSAPDDICLYIYTSGTTGPPKGCLLSHGNYRAITDAVVDQGVIEEGDSVYLFLPLAHAFAILIQFVDPRPRRDDRLLVEGREEDHPRPG